MHKTTELSDSGPSAQSTIRPVDLDLVIHRLSLSHRTLLASRSKRHTPDVGIMGMKETVGLSLPDQPDGLFQNFLTMSGLRLNDRGTTAI